LQILQHTPNTPTALHQIYIYTTYSFASPKPAKASRKQKAIEFAHSAPITCSHTDNAPSATQDTTPTPTATFSCAHTTHLLPLIGLPILDTARDNTPIRVYTHPCKPCHRTYCKAAQDIIEALYIPKINGYNMRVERMTELIENGEGGVEMVEARRKRYWQGRDVLEQMVSVDFWLWKPFWERWGELEFGWEEGEGCEGSEE